ncbi:MAG: AAA family ATPase [Candidatus Magnetominusculus sp. LBB02]|nr:AAA family ATPase [Candidatus Magnetominusculus sp. LBB02]
MAQENDYNKNDKAVRLVDYLLRLASQSAKVIRDIADADYVKVIWLSEIPRSKGCFTRAWESNNESYDSDIWIEIRKQTEPRLPAIAEPCKDWCDKSSLYDKNNLPDLMPELTRRVKNPAWQEGSDQSEFITITEHLADNPEIQRAWERYIEQHWLPWMEKHNIWEPINKVYSELFALHQDQLRRSEQYELVLGLGLLTWNISAGQRVCRHVIAANATIEFDARQGIFTVGPTQDGAKVRPELDMLDGEQLSRSESTAKKALEAANDDPWDNCVKGVVEPIVHSLDPQGQYKDTIERSGVAASSKPIIEYAPALILRKRSTKGLIMTLEQIKKRIETDGDIPPEFQRLAEISPMSYSDSPDGQTDEGTEFVFFPKPSNEEQRRIVDKIRNSGGVVVQGPPGTGKSHTIANLICHLLATGQRILVTAKTPRALAVLNGLLPPELGQLCINMLSSGLEEKESLEASVRGILHKSALWDEKHADKERDVINKTILELKEEKSEIENRLRVIRESENYSHSIAEGNYHGTAKEIAEAVSRDSEVYGWFIDKPQINMACPIPETFLPKMLEALRHFTPDKRQELCYEWPEALPSAAEFANLVKCEKMAIDNEDRLKKGVDGHTAELLSESNASAVEAITDVLSAFNDKLQHVSISAHPWIQDVLNGAINGNSALWRERYRVTKDIITLIEPRISAADDNTLVFPKGADMRALLNDVCELKQHIDNGGGLGWWLFRPKLVKERIHVLKTVLLNGRACTIDHLSVLADALYVRVECQKAWDNWTNCCEPIEGHYFMQLQALKIQCDALDAVFELEELLKQCRAAMRQCPTMPEPNWLDGAQIKQVIAVCLLILAGHKRRLATDGIHGIELPLVSFAAKNNAHPITKDLIQAVGMRNIDLFAQCESKIQALEKDRQQFQKVNENMAKLRYHVPKMTEELERTCNDTCWDTRVQQRKARSIGHRQSLGLRII